MHGAECVMSIEMVLTDLPEIVVNLHGAECVMSIEMVLTDLPEIVVKSSRRVSSPSRVADETSILTSNC